MSGNDVKLSIIIVAYKAEEALERCLGVLPEREDWEVVVVDNNVVNRGFAMGCNVGARRAVGDYLLFLNPDVVMREEDIELLLAEIQRDKQVGIVAPVLVDEQGEFYFSYSRQPTWWNFGIVYSFLSKVLRFWGVVRRHWMWDVELDQALEVGIVSGAVLMIRQADFWEVGGFDERFFMYWEEVDLCRRLLARGRQVLLLPEVEAMHAGGMSSGGVDGKRLFVESRWMFTRKHFGLVWGSLLEGWLRLQEYNKLLAVGVMLCLLGVVGFCLFLMV